MFSLMICLLLFSVTLSGGEMMFYGPNFVDKRTGLSTTHDLSLARRLRRYFYGSNFWNPALSIDD